MLDDDDPGWPVSPRMVLFMIPLVGLFYRRRPPTRREDGLVLLRQLFVTFCSTVVMFGIVLGALYPSSKPPTDPPNAVIAAFLIFGGIGVLWSSRFEPPVKCTSDATLAATYRARFFFRIAFSQAAALFGFVGFFLTYDWWPYPVGVMIAAYGLSHAAPTRSNLRRDQERLTEQGCFRPLVQALRSVPPAHER